MADPTEFVEITYKLKFTSKLSRKQYYTGMTDQEIIDYVTFEPNAAESIIFALQDADVDDILKVKVKFTSAINPEMEEE